MAPFAVAAEGRKKEKRYLRFEPITLEKQRAYRARLALCGQQASDYSFLNLWGWAEEYGLAWAWEGELVWIRQTVPQTVYWAPVGPWAEMDWPAWYRHREIGEMDFTRVPEDLANLWRKELGDCVRIEPERDHWDYLYSTRELVELKGNRFHKKKNLLNQFQRKNDFFYAPLESRIPEHAIGMQEDWCSWKDCESSEILAAENRAILKIFLSWERFENLMGGALYVDRMIVAYTVAEKLAEDTVLIHFEKGCPEYKGVYQAMNQMFLESLPSQYRWVNREQDLGEAGLRKAKLSYHPVKFLRKYQAFLK